MKKIFAFIAVAMMFVATSCGTKTAETEVADDAVEVVDSVSVDSVEVVDTVAVDSLVVE